MLSSLGNNSSFYGTFKVSYLTDWYAAALLYNIMCCDLPWPGAANSDWSARIISLLLPWNCTAVEKVAALRLTLSIDARVSTHRLILPEGSWASRKRQLRRHVVSRWWCNSLTQMDHKTINIEHFTILFAFYTSLFIYCTRLMVTLRG